MTTTTIQHIADTIIHTRELLSEREFDTLSKAIYRDAGIVSLSRNPHTPRFLMVIYNTACTRSTAILEVIRQHGFQASIVGI
jgi:hypothetical protein